MNINNIIHLLRYVGALTNSVGEKAIQNKICMNLKALSIEKKLRCIWFHVPNEQVIHPKKEAQNMHEAAFKERAYCNYGPIRCLHRLGLIPGAPDLVFIGKEASLLMEIKSGKNKQQPNQEIFQEWAESVGVDYVVCHSWEEARKALIEKELLIL